MQMVHGGESAPGSTLQDRYSVSLEFQVAVEV